MWDHETIMMIVQGVGETLYMTVLSTVLGYLFGLPMGVLLAVSDKEGLKPNAVLYKILDAIANIVRSIPFLILLILLIPFTRAVVGKSYGSTATVVPLVVAAIPFIARMVESSIKEVDAGVIEAARAMGASNIRIIVKVLLVEARTSLITGATIAIGTILGYSAMSGAVGGGGLGDIAIRYGYYRYQSDIMIVTVILLVVLFAAFVPLGLWISALASGVKIGVGDLIGMRLRRVAPKKIVMAMVKGTKAGLNLNLNQVEAHLLAGGNVDSVVNALIAAERSNIELTFEQASAIDLAGRDVFEAVTMTVTPKVISTPSISAVAKDGIELLVTARVTVRTNIARLIGGAGESTVLARIGEGIVTTVGSAEKHSDVLENPDEISKVVLQKGLDSGTAYEIISIDIADIDIGRNIGANLKSLQAEADKKIAQAKAEERRVMAIALEQEMRAAVVAAEAEVPKAMAEALRSGNMGVMDYYRLQNVQADTGMKTKIGSGIEHYTAQKKGTTND